MLNQSSEFIKQAKTGQKRINVANGTKTYQVVKHVGSFLDVFKGTAENGDAAYTLACEIPLRAQVYGVSLFIVPRSGKSNAGVESYPIANANVTEDKKILAQIGVLPLNVMRDLIGSNAGTNLDTSILSKIKEYCVPVGDNGGFNLYGNVLKTGRLYPMITYTKKLRTATGNQTFPAEISLNVISQSSYAPIVSCRHASYNVFAQENGDVITVINADGRHRNRFRLASTFLGNTKQNADRYNAFNSGTGIIVVRSMFCRDDNEAAASNANFDALFADASYANLDVVMRLIYGEPYDDDITAMSTEYFIR